MTTHSDKMKAWHHANKTAVESYDHFRRISGPIPNAHLFFDLPQVEREERLNEIMQFAMETAQSSIRFGIMATVYGIAQRKGIQMDLAAERKL